MKLLPLFYTKSIIIIRKIRKKKIIKLNCKNTNLLHLQKFIISTNHDHEYDHRFQRFITIFALKIIKQN